MAIENFEGKNIQDTFQRVVQTDETNQLADGTGSVFIPVSSSHAITASYAISASHEIVFETSSSHAQTADTLGGLNTSITELNRLDGISTTNATHLKTMNQNVSTTASPTFFQVKPTAVRSDSPSIVLPDMGDLTGVSHLKVEATDGDATPGLKLGSTDEDIIQFILQNGDIGAKIDANGVFQGTVSNAEAATTATNAVKVDVANDTGNAEHPITFIDDTSPDGGYEALKANASIKVNPSTGTLTTTKLTATGDISSSGTITANTYVGLPSGILSSSAQLPSGILSGSIDLENNLVLPPGVISSSAQLPSGIYSSSLQTLGNITSSDNISASGTITANNATINEGYVTVTGSSTSHGFELSRDGLDTYKIRHLDGGLTIQNSSDSRKEMTFDGTGKVGIGNNDPQEILTVEGNISSSGNIISTGTGSFARVEATSDVALQVTNSQQIVFENALGTEFGNIFMNTDDQMLFQNLRSNKNVIIRAGNSGNEGHFIIQPGGDSSTNIAKFGTSQDLDLLGNFTASGNIKANYIETAKIPLIQYISTDATSTAQGRVLASGTHNNATDSFALEWDTPLFEDTDFFETGSHTALTASQATTFAVKQDGRYEINCNVSFQGTSGARPGINLGIFTSSNVSTVGNFRPKGPAAHAYVRVSGQALGSTAAIPGFVIQLTSGSAISMKVDLKDTFGATGQTFWSGSLSHFSMKKIG